MRDRKSQRVDVSGPGAEPGKSSSVAIPTKHDIVELDKTEMLKAFYLWEGSANVPKMTFGIYHAIISRELNIRLIETVCIASYHDYVNQGEMNLLKGISPELLTNEGEGILVVDDLTDTGKTAAEVRAMLPKAHFACVYAKPKGVPTIDTFVTEVSQDTWIYFPWDMGFTYQEPIAKGSKG